MIQLVLAYTVLVFDSQLMEEGRGYGLLVRDEKAPIYLEYENRSRKVDWQLHLKKLTGLGSMGRHLRRRWLMI